MKLKLFILSILAVFAPAKPMLVTVGVLVIVDLITGILAARKRGEPITSSGLRRTVAKMFIFQAAVLMAFLTETYMTGDLVPVCKIVSAFIGLVEYTSILENLNEINGSPIFQRLIRMLSKKEKDLDQQ